VNKIKCIKLSIHEDILKDLEWQLRYGMFYGIVRELAESVVHAFDNYEEGVIIVPKKKEKENDSFAV
jgi:hypothetical protein